MTSAVNDTLAVNYDPEQLLIPKSTLALKTAVTTSAKGPAAGVTPSNSSGLRCRGSGRRGKGSSRGKRRGVGSKNC